MSEILNCDAFDYLKSIKPNSIDLIILDPNYQDWEEFLNRGILEECFEILKPTGNILCFTKQPFDFKLRVKSDKWFRREIVWTFENGGAWVSKDMPLVSTQKIYWLIKSKDFYFEPRTGVAYSENTQNFKRTNKVFEGFCEEGRDFVKSEDGVWLRDHMHYNKPNCGNIPMKPYELIRILIKCFCPKNGIVLDPFSGSGVIPIVCADNGIEFMACELDSERAENILREIKYHTSKKVQSDMVLEPKENEEISLFDFLK